MIWLTFFYSVIVLVLATYFYAAGGFTSRWWRFGSVGVLALVVALGITAFALLLSHPKPFYLEYSKLEETEILGVVLIPDRGIYLWLRFKSGDPPYYYVLSWTGEQAESLRALLRVQKPGQKLMLKQSRERYWVDNAFFLVDAPTLPLKVEEKSEVLYYNPEQQP